jgi:cytochrome c oxidase subunit 4
MSTDRPHVTPFKTYIFIAGTLLLLTVLTVTMSFVHLGPLNVTVALFIASVKALLVAFFFMHLFWDKKIYLIIFSLALIFLTIFLTFTMFDTTTRGSIYKEGSKPIRPDAPMYQKSE